MPDIDAMDYAYNTSRAIPCYDEDGSLFYYDAIGYGGSNVSHKQFRYNILNEIRNSSNDYRGSTFRGESDFALQHPGRPGAFRCWKLYAQQHFLQEQWWGEKAII